MSEWKEIVEDGVKYWVHERLGNVMQISEDSYLAVVPKLIKIRPL